MKTDKSVHHCDSEYCGIVSVVSVCEFQSAIFNQHEISGFEISKAKVQELQSFAISDDVNRHQCDSGITSEHHGRFFHMRHRSIRSQMRMCFYAIVSEKSYCRVNSGDR